ncbi:protein-glutamate O-methyltransferase CheR [Bordetella sp. LUAb4]|uniref:CheR family methyltransferase n=1 Tax=Bordetella sp. LUAb4 TaxID=2843195 RepID=UPI001E5A2159|nr:protein-glutamate O-methyltransferase CheR [Bordetella sp. LUAb4]
MSRLGPSSGSASGPAAGATPADDAAMKLAFNGLLKQRIGLDADAIGQATIDRAVRQRAQACHADNTAEYWRQLVGSREEQQQLIETVVVPETSFFRHPESMDTLALLARQRLAQGGQLRLLSLPCSSGEEAYTLGMALLDAGIDASRFSVIGVDISARLVEHARQGVYGRNSFRGEALGFRARHFNDTAAGYSVLPRVRAEVSFQTGNLLDPVLDLPAAGFDFVFCRNLLIYFDEATQRAAVNVLMGLARPDGCLFVGPAEASLLTRMGLRQIEAPGAFAFHREVPAPSRLPATARHATRGTAAGARAASMASSNGGYRPGARAGAGATATAPAGSGARPSALPAFQARPGSAPRSAPAARAASLSAKASNPAASTTRASNVAVSNTDGSTTATAAADTDASASLAAVQALADAGRISAALDAGARHLEQHGASASAYYLIGVLHDAAGASAPAEAAYRKALYLEPGHHEALLHLASMAEARGDATAAQQLRQRAARAGGRHG